MPIKTHIQTGIYAFEIEAKDEKELIERVAFLSTIPSKCPLCGAEVRLDFRTPQGFSYYGMHCLGEVKHEKTFGQNKPNNGGGLFDYDDQPWVQALTTDEWKKRAKGGSDYKCEICGTNDNSAHSPDCANNTSGDQVVNRNTGQKRRDAPTNPEPEKSPAGRPLKVIDENGAAIEAQILKLQEIYAANEWDPKPFESWTFKQASTHIQKCDEMKRLGQCN